jgi:hypothetical protein
MVVKTNFYGDIIEDEVPDPAIEAAKVEEARKAEETKEAEKRRLIELETADKLRGETDAKLEEARDRERDALLRAGVPPGTHTPVKEEAQANPFDPSIDPQNYFRFEADQAATRRVNELIENTLKPVAQKIQSDMTRLEELSSAFHEQQINSDEFFSFVKADYDAEIAKLPANQKSNVKLKRDLLDMVKGRNIKLINTQIAAKAQHHSETGTTGIVKPASTTPKLSEGQLNIAKMYGLTPVEYAKDLEDMGVAVEWDHPNLN